MIGKPGGALTCECIATNTPLIIPSFFSMTGRMKQRAFTIYPNLNIGTRFKKIVFMIKYIDWNKFLENFKNVKKENSCKIIYNSLKKIN